MEVSEQIEGLLALAEAIGYEVRYAPLDGQGAGACRLRGRDVLFVDTQADRQTRLEAIAGVLARRPEVERHYIAPQPRALPDRAN